MAKNNADLSFKELGNGFFRTQFNLRRSKVKFVHGRRTQEDFFSHSKS